MEFDLEKYNPHILEFIYRLKICTIFFIISSIVGYLIKEKLLAAILLPLSELQKINAFSINGLIYTNLIDGFVSYIKISFIFGFILTLPMISWHMFKFIAPGLYKSERFVAKLVLIFGPILSLIGCCLAYYIVIPNAWKFFYSFSDENLMLLPKISEYISLMLSILLGFGIAFQFPVIIALLYIAKIVNLDTLVKYRRLMIFINFVIGGIATPPDILSQFLLAIPLIIMYEFAIITCKLIRKKC